MSLPSKADVRAARRVLDALPELLAARRDFLGHGYRPAAERIGIAYPALSRIEHRQADPFVTTALAIIDYLEKGKP